MRDLLESSALHCTVKAACMSSSLVAGPKLGHLPLPILLFHSLTRPHCIRRALVDHLCKSGERAPMGKTVLCGMLGSSLRRKVGGGGLLKLPVL